MGLVYPDRTVYHDGGQIASRRRRGQQMARWEGPELERRTAARLFTAGFVPVLNVRHQQTNCEFDIYAFHPKPKGVSRVLVQCSTQLRNHKVAELDAYARAFGLDAKVFVSEPAPDARKEPYSMSSARRSRSIYLVNTWGNSSEKVLRALLLSDEVRMAGIRIDGAPVPPHIETLIESGHVSLTQDVPDVLGFIGRAAQEWVALFGPAVIRALEAGSVSYAANTGESHRGTGRIVDNGKGMLPPRLWGEYEHPAIATAIDDMVKGLRIDDLPQFPRPLAEAAARAMAARTVEMAIIDLCVDELSRSSPDYARIGMLGGSRRQVQWISGLLRERLAYDYQDDATVSAVIDATMGRPQTSCRLQDIPIRRFVDICDSLADARNRFGQEVVRWSSTIAALESPLDRRERLRQIRRDEILPAMEEFNANMRTDLKKIVGAVEGASIAAIAIGGFAAAVCGHYHVPTDGPAVTAASTAALAVTANAGKRILDRKRETRQTWMAFASALSDEVQRLEGMK